MDVLDGCYTERVIPIPRSGRGIGSAFSLVHEKLQEQIPHPRFGMTHQGPAVAYSITKTLSAGTRSGNRARGCVVDLKFQILNFTILGYFFPLPSSPPCRVYGSACCSSTGFRISS